MAHTLHKYLNNDLCDEINKLVVNETIKDLNKTINKLKEEVEKLNETKHKYYLYNIELLTNKRHLNNDCKLLEEELAEISPVDIDDIMVNLTKKKYSNSSEIEFVYFINNICTEKGIAYDISETYNNFEDWFNDVLHCFLDYKVYDMKYNISLTQLFEAKKYSEEQYGSFDFKETEEETARLVVYILLVKEFKEDIQEIDIVNYIIDDLKIWYFEKINEEEEENNQ